MRTELHGHQQPPGLLEPLSAVFINTTLTRSPELSHTQRLIDISAAIMAKQGVEVEQFRSVDHTIASGVFPDMRQHGWAKDEWPELFVRVMAADILVIAGPIWLGDNSSETKKVIERLYAHSGELNEKGQWLYYGKVGGCLITGNEDGIKHCTSNVLYSLQHIGYSIAPSIGRRLDRRSGAGPELRRCARGWQPSGRGQRLHQSQYHLHDLESPPSRRHAQGCRGLSRLRQSASRVGRRNEIRLLKSRVPVIEELHLPPSAVRRPPGIQREKAISRQGQEHVRWREDLSSLRRPRDPNAQRSGLHVLAATSWIIAATVRVCPYPLRQDECSGAWWRSSSPRPSSIP